MTKLFMVRLRAVVLCSSLFSTVLVPGSMAAQKSTVVFDSTRWDLNRAVLEEHLGRPAMMGTAYLKDVIFGDGIIGVDIATTDRSRSYPGVLFRILDPSSYERIYIRPHRSLFYDDALQYAPVFNGVDSWQLYNGTGKTAGLDILPGQWNHLKIMVARDQARVFWNDTTAPVLVIDHLTHGNVEGSLGLSGPTDGTAYFSSFSYEAVENLSLPAAHPSEPMCGIITGWELSQPFPLLNAEISAYPREERLSETIWQHVDPDETGIIDVSRFYPRNSRAGDCILAKTVLPAESDTLLRTGFGYSDYITVFLNRKPVYFGNSAYRSRDRSFLGIVGFWDNLFLPLTRGENELMVQVCETSGGWAFGFRKEDEVYLHPSVDKGWTLRGPFSMPECIVYDPVRDVCYVSNYFNDGNEFISKISLSGEVITRDWITGIRMPTGMCITGDTLYAVERRSLQVVDPERGEVVRQIPLTGMIGPNDVAADAEGYLYISDMPANTVYRYSKGSLDPWLTDLDGPNGLLADQGFILIGENEQLLRVSIADKSIETLAVFERDSNIDGIQTDEHGNYLVSDYRGKLYHITSDGSRNLMINSSVPSQQIADFCFIPGKKMLIIPTFSDNSVEAFFLE
ncbi:MAG: SMP-30/gluconolactonase/LRE family protein [Bacteroidales bacterium]|nr:SMP-30/gluconolactonase/LRE family protein [Bacteroidales bacterium]